MCSNTQANNSSIPQTHSTWKEKNKRGRERTKKIKTDSLTLCTENVRVCVCVAYDSHLTPKKERKILYDRIWFFYVNFGFVEIALQHQCLLLKWFLSLRVTFNCLLKLFFGAQFARTSIAMALFFTFLRRCGLPLPYHILMYVYMRKCDGTTTKFYQIWYSHIVLIMNTVEE